MNKVHEVSLMGTGSFPVTKELVVPFAEQERVLKALHEHAMAGHMGTMTTYNRIRERFWWPNLYGDVGTVRILGRR